MILKDRETIRRTYIQFLFTYYSVGEPPPNNPNERMHNETLMLLVLRSFTVNIVCYSFTFSLPQMVTNMR